MGFNWINLALSSDPIRDRVPATCFEWMEHVVATDRARIHIWYNPEAAMFCESQDTLVDWKVNQLFQIIESRQPELIFEERQDEHWVYIQVSDGSWLTLNRQFYEELKIPFSDTPPVIGSNDVGRFICFKSGNCMGALMEYKTK